MEKTPYSPSSVVQQKKFSCAPLTACVLTALLLTAGFVAGMHADQLYAGIAPLFGVKASADTIDLSSVQQTYRELKMHYDGKLDTAKLIDGASRGLAAATGDPYTVFMDKNETTDFERSISGKVSGIGVEISMRDNKATITRVIDDSPAAKAGLKTGDIFLTINDQEILGQTSDIVASKVRGDAGTTVKITVQRGQSTENFSIVRANVSDASVRSTIRDGVGILTITRFDEQTGALARQAAERFKQENVQAVILDLRNNGGGYVNAAQAVASLWLENRVVVSERSDGETRETLRSSGEAVLKGVKTIVLVNNSSASASEIVAGALQDHRAATLLGEKTYGKGTVQQVISLAGGRQLKVTVARWYTPRGKNISRGGIAPDTEVKMTVSDYNNNHDPQLDAALKQIMTR